MYTTRLVRLSGFQALSSRRQVLARTWYNWKTLSRHQDHIRLRLAMAETQATSDHYLDEMEDILPIFPPAGRTNVTPPSPPPLHRSQRIRHPPQWYI